MSFLKRTRRRANCEVYLWDYFRVQQCSGWKTCTIQRFSALRHNEIRSGSGKREKGTERDQRIAKCVTQRNGVSKEGARRASDKSHNTLARDDPPGFMHASKSPWRMRLGMRFLERVCCVPRLPRAKSRKKENGVSNEPDGKSRGDLAIISNVFRAFLRFILFFCFGKYSFQSDCCTLSRKRAE